MKNLEKKALINSIKNAFIRNLCFRPEQRPINQVVELFADGEIYSYARTNSPNIILFYTNYVTSCGTKNILILDSMWIHEECIKDRLHLFKQRIIARKI